MVDHLTECPLLEPCSADHPEHGFCSRQNTICIHCERQCFCERLLACEQRVFQEQITGRQHDMVLGYQRGLAAARRAVQVLPKGGMGQKAHELWRDSLAAIDALKEQR